MQILSWFAKVCTAGSDNVVGAPGLRPEVEDYCTRARFSTRTRRCGWRSSRSIGMSSCHREGLVQAMYPEASRI